MKFCTKCGASLEDKALFCTKCGASMSSEVKAEQTPDAEPTIVIEEPIKTVKPESESIPSAKSQTASAVNSTPRVLPASTGKKEPKQPSGIFVKLLCILLSFKFCTLLFATSVIGIVRNTFDPDMIVRNIVSVDVEEIGELKLKNEKGKDVTFAEYVLDFCNDEVIEKYDLDEDKIIEVIKDTKVDEFLGEIIGDYVSYIVDGDDLRVLDGERIVSWIRENEEAIEAVVRYEFKEADYAELERELDKSDVIKSLSEKELEREIGGEELDVIKHGLSLYIYIIMIVVVVAVGGLIIVVNKKKVRAAFTYVTVCLAVVGGIFLLLSGAIFATVSIVLPELTGAFKLIGVIVEPFVMPILIRGAIMFGFGLIASIVYKIVSDRKRARA